MPVNMDPAKKDGKTAATAETGSFRPRNNHSVPAQTVQFGEETEEDRVKELADAEQKNLWEATEVIDMDKV